MNKYITSNSKVRVIWKDLPENNTVANKSLIKNRIAKEYGVDKTAIAINFVPALPDKEGNLIEITGANMENILDTNYQHQLFKEWLNRENIEIDFDKILEFDKEVELELKGEFEPTNIKNWDLEWLKINNFLSYGQNNTLNFNELDGLNIIKSMPGNFSGKTTLTVDAILFLFLGKTTKTSKNEDIFNRFTTENTLSVKGLVNLNSVRMIIERKLTRSEKRGGGWNIKSQLNYTKILADGSEEILSEEDSIKTTLEIKKMVGNEDTFNLTIITTGDNLTELITSTPTENGKLMNKLIGLEAIEAKEVISRKIHNDFKKSKLSNIYSPAQLIDDNETYNENIEILDSNKKSLEERIADVENERLKNQNILEELLSNHKHIDVNINQLDKSVIISDIDEIKKEGVEKSTRLKGLDSEIENLKQFSYDEVEYTTQYKNKLSTLNEITSIEAQINSIKHDIEHLKNSDKCPTCNQSLPDIDNSKDIKDLEETLDNIINTLLPHTQQTLKVIEQNLSDMDESKSKYDSRNKLEIERDRLELEVKQTRLKYKERSNDLKIFERNEEAILFNNENNTKIGVTRTNITISETSLKDLNGKLNSNNNSIFTAKENIKKNNEILEKIKEEINKEKVMSTYVDMVGKKGINKIVIRSVLPVINSELQRMLEDTAEFEVSVEIDNKNEIEFFIVKDDVKYLVRGGSGYEKTVASLALRCVLSRVSQLPMPNFITFDEVLGKVSPENYPLVQNLFDKIKEMYKTVLLIVHEEGLNEWGDRTITVRKENNISSIH